jgi:hypothetical protein
VPVPASVHRFMRPTMEQADARGFGGAWGSGSRVPADVTVCSEIDLMSAKAGGRFVRKDGTPA